MATVDGSSLREITDEMSEVSEVKYRRPDASHATSRAQTARACTAAAVASSRAEGRAPHLRPVVFGAWLQGKKGGVAKYQTIANMELDTR